MYSFLLTVLSIIFVFIAIGFCVFSHELGHFLAAKWRGLHVDSFALGFRPFFRKKYKGVEYRIGYLPFGGYCEIPQVDATGDVPVAADGTPLPRAKAVDRIITAVAGPLFNILSGLLVACIIWAAGLPQASPKMREIEVRWADSRGPEYAAGLRAGDKIVKVNNKPFFCTWEDFCKEIVFAVGEVTLDVKRGGTILQITYTPVANPYLPPELRKEGIAVPFFMPVLPIELTPQKNSVAALAGIAKGDFLLEVNGVPVTGFSEYQLMLDRSGGRAVKLLLKRGGKEFAVTVVPQLVDDPENKFTRYLIGVNMNIEKSGIVVSSVGNQTPAALAGLAKGDILESVDGRKIGNAAVLQTTLAQKKGKSITLVWSRDGKKMMAEITPEVLKAYTIGADISLKDYPSPVAQLAASLEMSWKSVRGIAVGIGNKLGLTDKQSTLRLSHLSGPLGIGMVLFDSVRHNSFIYAIYFIVVISFALAIFNLLPLPVLDGGHILFGIVEMIIRRPIPAVIIKVLSAIFVVLLILMMLFVTFSDGRRFVNKYVVTEKIK